MRKIQKRAARAIAAFCLMSALLLGCMYVPIVVQADTIPFAMAKCKDTSTVNVRQEASTSSAVLDELKNGYAVSVAGETAGQDGYQWYLVKYTKNASEITGYIRSDCLAITQVDRAYTQQLISMGFPESYALRLAMLHEKYPSWNFEAVRTGIDWNHAVAMESRLGYNLVSKSSNDSRKSTESGAYNWNTNTWTGFDGASWVAADQNYIAYRMDPRNYLDETYIFMFEALSYRDTQTIDGVNSIIGSTFMAKDATDGDKALNYADAFMKIGKECKVSPYHLASRVRQEQGNGTSNLISGTYPGYEGYYNYFNVSAVNNSNGTATTNGLAKAKQEGWNTRYKSLYGGAELLAKRYIAKGQDTLYFEKFNVVNHDALFAHQYMGNVDAAYSEAKSVAAGYSNKAQAFEFRIPVYDNMPASAVSFIDTGNPNNYLKSLSVSGYNLTPTFNGSVTNYSLIVPSGVSSVTIAAAPAANTSKVSGTGQKELQIGNNVFEIQCTSQSGSILTYTLTIARQAESAGTISSSVYQINNGIISKITPGTDAASLLAGIQVTGGTAKILQADGTENTGKAATGNVLAVYVNGTQTASYPIVIYGDVNGDGKISNADIVKLKRHILSLEQLAGSGLNAADINKDGRVSNADIVKVKRHIIGLEIIQ